MLTHTCNCDMQLPAATGEERIKMPAPKPLSISAEKLREMLDYNADTGEFRWKVSPAPSVRVGAAAGYRTSAGGRAIMIGYRPQAASRLAWLHAYGEEPAGMIRHVNGDKSDDRLINLRVKVGQDAKREDISLRQLRETLAYQPEDGVFYWNRARGGPAKVDADGATNRAGVARSDGYVVVGYLARTYLAHRLAWFYVHGAWPKDLIDHINGDRGDNRLCNLREVRPFENSQNRALKSTNTTGMTGVYQQGRRWFARATVNNVTHTVGYFKTKEEAAAARESLAAQHIGEFARQEKVDPMKPENSAETHQ